VVAGLLRIPRDLPFEYLGCGSVGCPRRVAPTPQALQLRCGQPVAHRIIPEHRRRDAAQKLALVISDDPQEPPGLQVVPAREHVPVDRVQRRMGQRAALLHGARPTDLEPGAQAKPLRVARPRGEPAKHVTVRLIVAARVVERFTGGEHAIG
jgi:hypothetical protein